MVFRSFLLRLNEKNTVKKEACKIRFSVREILNQEHGDIFCIFKNIGLFFIKFLNFLCSWIFDFCIFYAKLKFPVR